MGTWQKLQIAVAFWVATATPASIHAAELQAPIPLDIPASDLDIALQDLARQTDLQMLYAAASTFGKKTPPIHDSLTVSAALQKLLERSNLQYQITDNVVVIYPIATNATNISRDALPEMITVTGFRARLDSLLAIKRSRNPSSETVQASDIATLPTVNVADALQYASGATVNKMSGESNQISVRGLGPVFTQVRINGMETLATAGSAATFMTNRGRAFDFNVFAAEMFDHFTVLKSSSADLDEGSLGVTVDMHTGRPFDRPGPFLGASARVVYNDLAHSSNPRFALLASDTFLGGRLGVLASAAYGTRQTTEQGYSTIRFTNDNSTLVSAGAYVPGCTVTAISQCTTSQRLGGVVVTQPLSGSDPNQMTGALETTGSTTTLGNNYDILNEAYKPRFARYDLSLGHQERIGLTGSVQWKINDDTLVSLDGLLADYRLSRNEYSLESNSFANPFSAAALGGAGTPASLGTGNVVVTNYTVDLKTNTVTTMTGNGFGLRDEASRTDIDSRFEQMTLEATHTVGDKLAIHLLAGWSESHMRNPLQVLISYDYNGGLGTNGYNGVIGFRYDFSGGYSKMPGLYFGSAAAADGSVTGTDGWFVSQIRVAQEFVFNAYRTIRTDASWQMNDWLRFRAGADYKNYGYRTVHTTRSDGTTAVQDYTLPSAIRSADLKANSTVVSLKGSGAPAGSGTTFMTPDVGAWMKNFAITDETAFGGAFGQGFGPNLGNNGSVNENDVGLWLKMEWNGAIGHLPIRGDMGARLVITAMNSMAYYYDPVTASVGTSMAHHGDNTILPSLNVTADVTNTIVIRLNAAKTLTHPDLPDLLPTSYVAVGGANRVASIGNPQLKPYTSRNVDLAVEWYYEPNALLSVALFYKHIDTLVQRIHQNFVYHGNAFGLPDDLVVAACGSAYGPACNENLIWSFATPINTKGRPLYGAEFSWQQPFRFLPAPFDRFGFVGNLTLARAQQTYFNLDGTVYTHADLVGLTHTTYNATLYYDDGAFDLRLAAAYRGKYIAALSPGDLNDQLVTAARLNLDLSSTYKLDRNITVTFAAMNLTAAVQNQYIDSIGQRPYNLHQTGREISIGLRYRN